MKISVKKIVEICDATLYSGSEDIICSSFVKDTRILQEGDTYIGIKGDNFNGNDFYQEALDKGANCVILEKKYFNELNEFNDKPIILVENSILALKKLATYTREKSSTFIIGITGSVGKTSTKDLIASVMSQKYNTLKTTGNYNNHIGVPLTILKLKEHESAVIEMGMNHLGEISKVTKIAEPTMSVITNIGTAHIGILGSRENILKAKLEILEGMDKNAPIIINNDNDLLHEWYLKNKDTKNIITYGIDNQSDVMAKNITSFENGSEFEVDINNKTYKAKINVGGNHFVLNALCGICVGLENNIPVENILNGIRNFKLTANRMEISESDAGAKIINDSYNASYDSVKAALESLKVMNGNRKIAVLGDILELGDFSEIIHKKVGEEVYKNKIDILITVGENAKFIANEAKTLGMDEEFIFCFDNNIDAINKIKEIMKSDDCILLKASNGMRFKEIVDALI